MLRYVHKGVVKERAIEIIHMKDSCAESLALFIMNKLSSQGLDLQMCIGQCFDGASVMRGNMSGVQAIIRQGVPYTVYIHCYAHRLNLVLVKSVTEIPDFLSF